VGQVGKTHWKHYRPGGKPVKPYEAWCETVTDVIVGDANPKATPQEA